MSRLDMFLRELKLTPKQVKVNKPGSKRGRKPGSKRDYKLSSKPSSKQSNKEIIYMIKEQRKKIKEQTEKEQIKEQIKKQIENLTTNTEDEKDNKNILLNDIKKYGIGDYTQDHSTDLIIAFEKDRHKFLKERYTDKQLKNTIDKINKSFIIKGSVRNPCKSKAVIDYLCFIEHNPKLALPTLLWLDTFHDFKHERLSKDKKDEGEETIKIDRNKILDYLCYRIYGKHWAGIEPDNNEGRIEDCVYINYEYNFDKIYQNSFFNFIIDGDNKPKVEGFHDDVKHTVLKPILENIEGDYIRQKEIANLLYNVSNVFIANSGNWEDEFLNAYIMYIFDFKKIRGENQLDILEQLKDISWSEISENRVPYYAKDVDEGSGNFLKGDLVIIPASLFDANKSNSSKKPEDFVNIPTTKIPLCNGYDFTYEFKGKFLNTMPGCNLRLKYGDGINNISLCSQDTAITTNIFCTRTSPSSLTIENVKNIAKNIKSNELYTNDIPNDINTNFEALLTTINNNYFGDNKCVKFPPYKQGMSTGDIVDVIIGLLYRDFFNNGIRNTKEPHNSLSPIISCKILDFWVALKRIGDFGQILQCKQLGIPLFTDDSMQILISMAACSSVIFTIDNFKILYYKGDIDSFVCSDIAAKHRLGKQVLNEMSLRRGCNVYRINPEYKNIINNYFRDNTTTDIDNKLKTSAKNVISTKFDVSGLITNIRKNCKVDIDEKRNITFTGKGFTSSSQQEQTFSLSSNSSLLNPSSTKSFNNNTSSSSSQPQNQFSMYVPQILKAYKADNNIEEKMEE